MHILDNVTAETRSHFARLVLTCQEIKIHSSKQKLLNSENQAYKQQQRRKFTQQNACTFTMVKSETDVDTTSFSPGTTHL